MNTWKAVKIGRKNMMELYEGMIRELVANPTDLNDMLLSDHHAMILSDSSYVIILCFCMRNEWLLKSIVNNNFFSPPPYRWLLIIHVHLSCWRRNLKQEARRITITS